MITIILTKVYVKLKESCLKTNKKYFCQTELAEVLIK